MRIPAEIHHGSRSFEPKHLSLANRAVLAVLIVTEKHRVDAAVGLETRARVRDIVRRVRRQNALDEIPSERAILGGERRDGNSGERAVSSLQLDSGLHWRFVEQRKLARRRIEMRQDALGEEELIAVDVAGQSRPFV